MPRDSAATKARLLEAAAEEFATHGIAGARVDRIAAAASANKNLIYVYFGNKQQLFDTVFNAAVGRLLEAAPLDVENLPEYTGALYDFYLEHPRLIRLSRWYGLEVAGKAPPLPAVEKANRHRLDAIATAQAAGLIDAELPPEHLLVLLLSLAATWSDGAFEAGSPAGPEEVAARRAAVVAAAARMVGPGRARP
jgi:AcrR family transcriptional regulator